MLTLSSLDNSEGAAAGCSTGLPGMLNENLGAVVEGAGGAEVGAIGAEGAKVGGLGAVIGTEGKTEGCFEVTDAG